METRVIQIARLMAAGENEQARICHVDMTGNEAEEEGMVCGGEVDVFPGGDRGMIEVEVKIPIESIEEIEGQLIHNGFKYQKTVVETDTYFTSDHYDMRKHDKALRIRTTENRDTGEMRAQLGCKGPKLDNISMTRKETEIEKTWSRKR